ncbi:MAG: sulfotransferase domain-containing protein [Phycisphaerales bacterium]
MLKLANPRRFIRLRALSHHVTWFLGKRYTSAIPLVFVIGYPKSGTTWICQLAADYLQLPFPRYSILPIGCPAVVHGHERVSSQYPRGIYVIRDGRDALTSLYFYLARQLPEGDHPQLSRLHKRLFPGIINRDDVATNIGPFVERQMTDPHAAKVNWGDHVRSAFEVKNHKMVIVTYEAMRNDAEQAFSAAMQELTSEETDIDRARATLEKFSFAKQAGRKAGTEDRTSFLRKGTAGDWQNHFTRHATEVFDRYCGESLIMAGYEPDRTWVTRINR